MIRMNDDLIAEKKRIEAELAGWGNKNIYIIKQLKNELQLLNSKLFKEVVKFAPVVKSTKAKKK